jgi:alpha-L-rhamnosidase
MAKKLTIWWLMMGLAVAKVAAAVSIGDLNCESRHNPVGIDVPRPQLNWIIESDRRGELQTAYQVLAASTRELLAANKGDLWDRGRVASNATAQVEYAG